MSEPLRTERLLLRRWRPEDRTAFAALNADPAVMQHFPAPMSREASDALADRIDTHFAERGFGWWAVEVQDVAPFIGCVGLSVPRFTAHFTPCVEIAWRLSSAHWGRGYAEEAARRALTFGFENLQLQEIVSFTVPANRPSWGLMERIGMTRDKAGDFEMPTLPEGHPLRPHLLYRLPYSDWQKQTADKN